MRWLFNSAVDNAFQRPKIVPLHVFRMEEYLEARCGTSGIASWLLQDRPFRRQLMQRCHDSLDESAIKNLRNEGPSIQSYDGETSVSSQSPRRRSEN